MFFLSLEYFFSSSSLFPKFSYLSFAFTKKHSSQTTHLCSFFTKTLHKSQIISETTKKSNPSSQIGSHLSPPFSKTLHRPQLTQPTKKSKPPKQSSVYQNPDCCTLIPKTKTNWEPPSNCSKPIKHKIHKNKQAKKWNITHISNPSNTKLQSNPQHP